MTTLSKRAEKALQILKVGGYFRNQLETQYNGREQFQTRLRDKTGNAVKGFGFKTCQELRDAQMLISRDCPRSSVWPTEFVLS